MPGVAHKMRRTVLEHGHPPTVPDGKKGGKKVKYTTVIGKTRSNSSMSCSVSSHLTLTWSHINSSTYMCNCTKDALRQDYSRLLPTFWKPIKSVLVGCWMSFGNLACLNMSRNRNTACTVLIYSFNFQLNSQGKCISTFYQLKIKPTCHWNNIVLQYTVLFLYILLRRSQTCNF